MILKYAIQTETIKDCQALVDTEIKTRESLTIRMTTERRNIHRLSRPIIQQVDLICRDPGLVLDLESVVAVTIKEAHMRTEIGPLNTIGEPLLVIRKYITECFN